ncbi:5-(carboxyamino)imidazole ribonucleotide mutase [Alteripontixanthobacter maritimus]|uniref:N5-carboxyaminoimidazole ribonucleotide mutase n=1 Tax=Alteripontixanthobacter maritimus TaxID=2161824 RepID=A0A369QBX3_9SPHN|nr:5-(carboxyamino)imidazole ribonucleotide mutase [Alteripontixanthobacter maritimus]RDC61075.1 5-(carboxyamino)imidazole ribonucleotide mutase [Alteripontixanthobacter maritimus]
MAAHQPSAQKPEVVICMGSQSDWPTMRKCADVLAHLDVPHEARIVSAHRTPDRMVEFAKSAEAEGVKVIIAGAGGAAHLPGMIAAMTQLPVLGVPVQSKALSGQDSLLSIVQMPAGVPVGTLAIGEAGATNAGLMAAAILALGDTGLADRLKAWRAARSDAVADHPSD